MANATCDYTIPAGAANGPQGGKLQGLGFGPANNPPPLINVNESLTVNITWAGSPQSAPDNLTGYFVFSSAPAALATQTSPSPFYNSTRYTCFMTQTAPKVSANGAVTFTFPAIAYRGSQPGKYELTFVAETGTGTTNATQWSADPEFDTSS